MQRAPSPPRAWPSDGRKMNGGFLRNRIPPLRSGAFQLQRENRGFGLRNGTNVNGKNCYGDQSSIFAGADGFYRSPVVTPQDQPSAEFSECVQQSVAYFMQQLGEAQGIQQSGRRNAPLLSPPRPHFKEGAVRRVGVASAALDCRGVSGNLGDSENFGSEGATGFAQHEPIANTRSEEGMEDGVGQPNVDEDTAVNLLRAALKLVQGMTEEKSPHGRRNGGGQQSGKEEVFRRQFHAKASTASASLPDDSDEAFDHEEDEECRTTTADSVPDQSGSSRSLDFTAAPESRSGICRRASYGSVVSSASKRSGGRTDVKTPPMRDPSVAPQRRRQPVPAGSISQSATNSAADTVSNNVWGLLSGKPLSRASSHASSVTSFFSSSAVSAALPPERLPQSSIPRASRGAAGSSAPHTRTPLQHRTSSDPVNNPASRPVEKVESAADTAGRPTAPEEKSEIVLSPFSPLACPPEASAEKRGLTQFFDFESPVVPSEELEIDERLFDEGNLGWTKLNFCRNHHGAEGFDKSDFRVNAEVQTSLGDLPFMRNFSPTVSRGGSDQIATPCSSAATKRLLPVREMKQRNVYLNSPKCPVLRSEDFEADEENFPCQSNPEANTFYNPQQQQAVIGYKSRGPYRTFPRSPQPRPAPSEASFISGQLSSSSEYSSSWNSPLSRRKRRVGGRGGNAVPRRQMGEISGDQRASPQNADVRTPELLRPNSRRGRVFRNTYQPDRRLRGGFDPLGFPLFDLPNRRPAVAEESSGEYEEEERRFSRKEKRPPRRTRNMQTRQRPRRETEEQGKSNSVERNILSTFPQRGGNSSTPRFADSDGRSDGGCEGRHQGAKDENLISAAPAATLLSLLGRTVTQAALLSSSLLESMTTSADYDFRQTAGTAYQGMLSGGDCDQPTEPCKQAVPREDKETDEAHTFKPAITGDDRLLRTFSGGGGATRLPAAPPSPVSPDVKSPPRLGGSR